MSPKTNAEKIVVLLLELSNELFRIKDITPKDLFPLLPEQEPREPFITAKSITNQIFSLVKKENVDMLSDEIIMSQLIYGVAAIRLEIQISDSELETRARKATDKLLSYQACRDVDIPLIFLQIGDKPTKFGPITFYQITPEDMNTEWWKKVRFPESEAINRYLLSYARVNVEGDLPTSIKKAKLLVRRGLLILRGICFPLSSYEKRQFGIINEYPMLKNIFYRTSRPKLKVRIDNESKFVTETGPFLTVYKLQEDLLNRISISKMEKFLPLLDKVGFSGENAIQRKIFSGFRWIGEATQPDFLETRYIKLAFALESFIGGEENDKYITSRGITAMLSERAAFLLEKDINSRKDIDKKIRAFYNKRSLISHGEQIEIQPNDFENFGEMVRNIGWSLVEKIDQFRSVDDLQKWVVDQRYS